MSQPHAQGGELATLYGSMILMLRLYAVAVSAEDLLPIVPERLPEVQAELKQRRRQEARVACRVWLQQ